MHRIWWVSGIAGAAVGGLLLVAFVGDGGDTPGRARRGVGPLAALSAGGPSGASAAPAASAPASGSDATAGAGGKEAPATRRRRASHWDVADAPWIPADFAQPRPEGARPRPGYQRSLWEVEAPPRDGSVGALAAAAGWRDSLRAAAHLPQTTAAGRIAAFKEALARATDPLARQNLIFQAALALPWEPVEPWLVELWRGDDPADAEDALLALAFSGHAGARAEFARLARTPEDRRLVRSLCGDVDAWRLTDPTPALLRRLHRSWRAIEVLDREPYHERHCFLVWYVWLDHPVTMLADWERLESELLRHWIARYPGHPGSDDMALRVARNETDPMEAARWYSRAACWPDQDVTDGGLFGLITMAEFYLTPEQIDRLAHEEGLDTPNRMLLLYVRLRRIAVERGFEPALREAAARAATEPACALARAWSRRWSVAPTRALDSGQAPLPPDDPLRAVRAAPSPPPPARPAVRLASDRYPPHAERMSGGEATARTPFGERLVLDLDVLARQFRTWETLAELERRARRAGRARRSDLLYKQAAVFYHEPDALYPVWAARAQNAPGIFRVRSAVHAAAGDHDARITDFRDRTLSLRRAIALFDEIEREDAGYAGLDAVVFSRGMAWRKLMEIRPFRPRRDADRFAMVRRLVAEFERCAWEFPGSPLAIPARDAAAWWRRNVPKAWRPADGMR